MFTYAIRKHRQQGQPALRAMLVRGQLPIEPFEEAWTEAVNK